MTKSKRLRHCWTVPETLGFLKCYRARRIEFLTGQKKLEPFDKVYQDMLKKGIINSESKLDGHILENRLKCLLVNFRNAVENPELAKRPLIAPYMSMMTILFGNVASDNDDDEEDDADATAANGVEEVDEEDDGEEEEEDDEEDVEEDQTKENADEDEDENRSFIPTDLLMPMSPLTPPGSDSSPKKKRKDNMKKNLKDKKKEKSTAKELKKRKVDAEPQPKNGKKIKPDAVENKTKPNSSSNGVMSTMTKAEFNIARLNIMKEANELNRTQKRDFFKMLKDALNEQWIKEAKIEEKKIELLEMFLGVQNKKGYRPSSCNERTPSREKTPSRENTPSPNITPSRDISSRNQSKTPPRARRNKSAPRPTPNESAILEISSDDDETSDEDYSIVDDDYSLPDDEILGNLTKKNTSKAQPTSKKTATAKTPNKQKTTKNKSFARNRSLKVLVKRTPKSVLKKCLGFQIERKDLQRCRRQSRRESEGF